MLKSNQIRSRLQHQQLYDTLAVHTTNDSYYNQNCIQEHNIIFFAWTVTSKLYCDILQCIHMSCTCDHELVSVLGCPVPRPQKKKFRFRRKLRVKLGPPGVKSRKPHPSKVVACETIAIYRQLVFKKNILLKVPKFEGNMHLYAFIYDEAKLTWGLHFQTNRTL